MNYINIILVVSILFGLSFKSKRYLHMLQQNLYNENNRYLKWLSKNLKELIDVDLVAILFAIVGLLLNKDGLTNTIIIASSIVYIFLGIFWRKRLAGFQNKKPLVITARVKRLIFTMMILYLIPTVLLFVTNSFIWVLVLSCMVYLNSIVVLICKFINIPAEKYVYHYYLTKAKKKLYSMNNLKVIGITGSYGKTSSKNILSDILNIKYDALPTPRNLNTPYGLMITINNHLDKFNDVFIAEMGAYVRGEIRDLCELVRPKYGILTRIGTAHLESFGSEENIVKGKFELIESLPSDGFAVLNMDDEKQVNYELKNKVKVIWIGIDNEEADVRAVDIKCSNKGTNFNVIFKGDKTKYNFQTKLLGDHSVYNILAGIACGREFGISIEELQQAVKAVRTVEHRLELKKLGNFYQIDDAYNSNPVGAKNACKVLGMMPGIKVVVTPGMIELGEKEDYYNKEFGKQIAEVADYAVLVGEEKTKPIKEGLLEAGYDEDKIIVYNDVRDAYSFIRGLTGKKEDVYALFENDLPDTYSE
ncbi:MAG: UDP-N-acetylmuramoyl-tripeptide--D-alanyl-D-alanine ligase [Firmicutes bacterium]|nr:UDP-N-acetylmuramoyl-tripeptide--D-alanyl-D-alanine ligase [Bacillota bacterium]